MPANVAPHYIRKQPLLSEKSTFAMNEQSRYVFLVDPRATKVEIKNAVETIYKVHVEKINTQVRKGKFRRLKFGLTVEPTTKKASIKIKDGEKIELF